MSLCDCLCLSFSFFKKALQVGKYGLFSFVISVKNALRICGRPLSIS
nr:MAG TPA: hypothetical protein [Caudoviricetes sp.]